MQSPCENLIWRIVQLLSRCADDGSRAVRVRFAGAYTVSNQGDVIVAAQQLKVGEPFTAPLIFTDENGNAVKGPIGAVTSSDASVTVGLSADGQAVNVTMTADQITATLTWTGNGKNGAMSATVDVTDQHVVEPPATEATGVAFGTFAPGSTA